MATKRVLSNTAIQDFQKIVFDYYTAHKRHLVWREIDTDGKIDPYAVTVSEIMLQQTQVARVQVKFEEFMHAFPTIVTLARAPFSDVLRVWNGLGYNRRARYLHEFAQRISGQKFPLSVSELTQYKGIGPNTAAAILIYSFDQRHSFVETNIRTVMLHHFFQDSEDKISDDDILKCVEATLPEGSVREWYWGLMDYGTYLKINGNSQLIKARAHKKQSQFRGSLRELRSNIVKLLLASGKLNKKSIYDKLTDNRIDEALTSLVKDKLIEQHDDYFKIRH